MKKAFLSTALALAVGGSWAFYSKAPAEPGGYMMVISNCAYRQSALITITPDGKSEEIPMPFRGTSDAEVSGGLTGLQKATLTKLNSLAATGWLVTQTSTASPSTYGGPGFSYNTSQTVYLLEKKH
jgi:hypothetical protein